jgi:hypothetical protein
MFIGKIKNHILAIFLAICVGAIYASHHFFIPMFSPDEDDGIYQPITANSYYDESLFYAPKAGAVFWGRGIGGDYSTAEAPDGGGPSIAAPLNPLILGSLMKLFGSVKNGLIASDFIFPAIIFILLYFLVYEITAAPAASSLFAIVFVFAPKLALALPPTTNAAMKEILSATFPFVNPAALHFSEFDEPKLTFVFVALFAYLFMRALRRGGKLNTIAAGISFGLLFYTYPYDWAVAAVVLVLTALFFLIQRRPYLARRTMLIFGIGAAASVFYWLNWLELSKTAPDVITRLGGEVGRFFRLETVWKHYLRIAALIPFLWWALRDLNKKARVFLAAYLLSFVVAVNIQVITGFNAQPDHWYRTQFLPVALSVFFILYYFLPLFKGEGLRRGIGVFVIAWFLAANFYGQYLYSAKDARAFYIPKDRYESYEWLKNNTPVGSVVGTLSFETNPAIQLFSHNKIFLPFGLSTLAANDELWERFMVLGKIFGITPKEFRKLIIEENGLYYLTVEQWGDKNFDAAFRDYDRLIHPDALNDRVLEYEFYLKSQNDRNPYRLDYIYFDKKDPRWGRDPKIGESVFENEAAIIYLVRNSPP